MLSIKFLMHSADKSHETFNTNVFRCDKRYLKFLYNFNHFDSGE